MLGVVCFDAVWFCEVGFDLVRDDLVDMVRDWVIAEAGWRKGGREQHGSTQHTTHNSTPITAKITA